MNCQKVKDKVYGDLSPSLNFSMPLFTRIKIGLHLLWCHDCTAEIERFEVCKDILREEFLPPSPALEDKIMSFIASEENEALEIQEVEASPGGFSLKGWVAAGIAMMVSFMSIFFISESDDMIPIGVTIGIVLTSYGALFICSHLKEFTHRFRL